MLLAFLFISGSSESDSKRGPRDGCRGFARGFGWGGKGLPVAAAKEPWTDAELAAK